MFKLIKLVAWIKSHWALLLIIATVLIGGMYGVQSCRVGKLQLEAARLDGKLQEQVKDQNLLYGETEKKDKARALAEAAEKQVRKDLEARIQKFQKDTVVGKRALRKEKEKTAVLPPTELVTQINERIGDESSFTGAGLFLFTRLGANNTLDRFKDGEFYLSEYNKFQGVITDHEAEVASFNTSIGECEKAVVDNLSGWMDCRVTLDTAQEDIKKWKKVGKGNVWNGRKQGALWTAIILGGFKLVGVW